MRLAALTFATLIAASALAHSASVETVAEGLEHPWGMAFLPDGSMLVTERPGRMRIVTNDDDTLTNDLFEVPAFLSRA